MRLRPLPRAAVAESVRCSGGSLGAPPEVRSRPPTMLRLTLLEWGFVPGRRREELSSAIVLPLSIGIVGRRMRRSQLAGEPRSARFMREGRVVVRVREDVAMDQTMGVVVAAEPPPPSPTPVGNGERLLTATPFPMRATGPPPTEAQPMDRMVMNMAALTVVPAAAVVR